MSTLFAAIVAAALSAVPEPRVPWLGIPRGEVPGDVTPAPRPPDR